MRQDNSVLVARGFSMVEVLVALVVLSVGLMGIAKMQALGISSNAVAGKRALAATQADSLAASMHENRAYWSSSAAVGTWLAAGPATVSCMQGDPNFTAACNPSQLAAYDLGVWAQSLNALLGASASGTVKCTNSSPITCTVNITWSEKTVAINTNGQAAAQSASGTNLPTYTLFVEP